MSEFNRKLLIIGIDGGTWNILNEAIKLKQMPYLENLKVKGAYGTLISTVPPISPSAWGTIQTGKDAINNHIYEFYTFNKKTKKFNIVNSEFLESTVWDILSNLGKKIALINIPMTFPPKKINGYIISGILTPSLDSNFTYPPDLKKKIIEKIPTYQLKYTEEKRHGNPIYNTKQFIENRIKNVKDRTKACVYILHNYTIDLLMVNFQANDILQHSLWGYLNKDHELYNEKLKNYIYQKFYRTLDFCIELLIEEFRRIYPNELLTIILSDHGFETHQKQFFLGDWLHHKGLLTIKKGLTKLTIKRKSKELIEKFHLGFIQTKILKILRKILKSITNTVKSNWRESEFSSLVDMERSLVFSTGIGLYGYIFFINKEQYDDKILKYLQKELNKLKDPENNKKIVKKIFTKKEIYEGEKPELIPDLIIQPERGYSFVGLYRGKKKFLEKISITESETIGKHSEEGILIINGNDVKSQKLADFSLRDITPTILNYFSIPLPDNLDGKVIKYIKLINDSQRE